jgi:hypothetical protein
MAEKRNQPGATVDYVVDENAAPLDLPDESTIRPAQNDEEALASTGPTNWWRYGLLALGAIALVLLLMQVFGGRPGTDVQSGTPVAEPEVTAPAPNEV